MSDQPYTLTSKLHARADAKLHAFCKERFGDLFDLCGKHHAVRPVVDEFPTLKSAMKQLNIPSDKAEYHGYVWDYAYQTLFATLRDKWRDKEVDDFIAQVESVTDIHAQLEGGDA